MDGVCCIPTQFLFIGHLYSAHSAARKEMPGFLRNCVFPAPCDGDDVKRLPRRSGLVALHGRQLDDYDIIERMAVFTARTERNPTGNYPSKGR